MRPSDAKYIPGPWEENSALLLECLKEAVCNSDGDSCRDCPYFEGESWRCSYDSECFGQRWLAAIRKAEGIK